MEPVTQDERRRAIRLANEDWPQHEVDAYLQRCEEAPELLANVDAIVIDVLRPQAESLRVARALARTEYLEAVDLQAAAADQFESDLTGLCADIADTLKRSEALRKLLDLPAAASCSPISVAQRLASSVTRMSGDAPDRATNEVLEGVMRGARSRLAELRDAAPLI